MTDEWNTPPDFGPVTKSAAQVNSALSEKPDSKTPEKGALDQSAGGTGVGWGRGLVPNRLKSGFGS